MLEITRILKTLFNECNRLFLKKKKLSQHIMMESWGLEEEKIIKEERDLFRLEKLKKKQLIPQLKQKKSF